MQIVNIPLKAAQFKLIHLISAHKLLQIAAQERNFNAVSWFYYQLQKLPTASYFMPQISSVKIFCNFPNQQMTQLKSFSITPNCPKKRNKHNDTGAEKSRPIELCPKDGVP